MVREASNIPIIVLSIKDTERDKVEALDLGADDYVAKPFGINEVLARMRVILRRIAQPPNGAAPCYQADALTNSLLLCSLNRSVATRRSRVASSASCSGVQPSSSSARLSWEAVVNLSRVCFPATVSWS